MLLRFTVKNYRSFGDETVFSMEPVSTGQKELAYSILSEKGGKKNYKGLCSAVIYGPNAAGKTNIIGAMDVFKTIVLTGNIVETQTFSPNPAAGRYELIPNAKRKDREPTKFSVQFLFDGKCFEYTLSIDFGLFLERAYNRRIVFEELKVNNNIVFMRTDKIKFGDFQGIKNLLNHSFKESTLSINTLAEESLDPKDLFLMNGFKTMCSPKLADAVSTWMSEQFIVIYSSDRMYLKGRRAEEKPRQSFYIDKILNKALQEFGIDSKALGYVSSKAQGETDESEEMTLCSFFEKEDKIRVIDADVFESNGTIRFTNLFPLILNVFMAGGTLVIDEFDASIHPSALMNLINIFHNDGLNKHKAQLIFNTHNPIFLSSALYRRDEIKLVERDAETGNSVIYSLADFGTTGRHGVRTGNDYMKNYFINRYGAIKDIDLSPAFEEALKEGKE